ncbi:hypothetical protein OHB35_14355 [Streptomyces phaeochromogenes]|uniref:Secreted protein n=1 Tax=Streptomyces phaeochromogenes TaxID=1923 RepID=A0ABZ1HAH0_STRPH|nr:hypothetical protein [Streptomyces phaeochromogenes]WSD14331.1 hypothetical protein OHB35_14355 [Streptomyces phaeochromogenes]
MPRVRTSRFVFALAALLVALQFFGVLVPDTSESAGNASAAAAQEWSTTAVVADRADPDATCGDAEQLTDSPALLVGRDRHRSVAEPDAKRSAGIVVRDKIAAAAPPGDLTTSHLASRSSATHALASLQTFRC